MFHHVCAFHLGRSFLIQMKGTDVKNSMFKSKWLAVAVTVGAILTTAVPQANAARVNPRIIGGEETDIPTVPWTVALMTVVEGNVNPIQFRGGTLIDESWVLTAAHCAEWFVPWEYEEEYEAPLDRFVATGESDLRNLEVADLLEVDEIVLHPQYDGL